MGADKGNMPSRRDPLISKEFDEFRRGENTMNAAAAAKPARRALDHKAVVSNIGPLRNGVHWVTLETRRLGTVCAFVREDQNETIAALRRSHANCSSHEIMVLYDSDILSAGEIIIVHA